MSDYTKFVNVEPIGGIKFKLRQDLKWSIGKKDSGFDYIVPSGSIFDVSIPKLLRLVISTHDKRFLKAAALHDHMLENNWSRAESGGIFNEALKADGVPKYLRLLMYQSVILWRYD